MEYEEQIKSIVDQIMILSEKHRHPDQIAMVHSVTMDIDLELMSRFSKITDKNEKRVTYA